MCAVAIWSEDSPGGHGGDHGGFEPSGASAAAPRGVIHPAKAAEKAVERLQND